MGNNFTKSIDKGIAFTYTENVNNIPVERGDYMVAMKEAREAQGVTQLQLANAIGRDRSLIAKIEKGNAKPSVETAKAIAIFLGLSWTIFFADKGEHCSHK